MFNWSDFYGVPRGNSCESRHEDRETAWGQTEKIGIFGRILQLGNQNVLTHVVDMVAKNLVYFDSASSVGPDFLIENYDFPLFLEQSFKIGASPLLRNLKEGLKLSQGSE